MDFYRKNYEKKHSVTLTNRIFRLYADKLFYLISNICRLFSTNPGSDINITLKSAYSSLLLLIKLGPKR